MNTGSRIRQARIARGLSMRELAGKVGVSPTAISKYEHGESVPRPSVLLRLARELGVQTGCFFRKIEVELRAPAYRKHGRFPAKVQKTIEAVVANALENYLTVESLFPEGRQIRFDTRLDPIASIEDAEEAAESLRTAWDIGSDPIDDLTARLEDHGVTVIMILLQGGFDGFSCWANETIPVVVCPTGISGDRQRFSLAHELGHLILDVAEGVDAEKVAHRFAGAFLVPRSAVFRELGQKRSNLDVDELMILRQEYGISMQAWVRRAYDLGIISQYTYRRTCQEFSRMRWRREEPGDQLPEESPRRFLLLVRQALAEGLISQATAAELSGKQLHKRIRISKDRLRAAADSMAVEYESNQDLVGFTTASAEDIYSYDEDGDS